uniref:Uncharacterized protein n=1 Tax=Timema poppense TaxID=170557 RepID=A0A7R9HFP0_TIMPO|nr:unnamed protein product [Timema poppensis]
MKLAHSPYRSVVLSEPVPHYEKYNPCVCGLFLRAMDSLRAVRRERERRTASSVAVQGSQEGYGGISLSPVSRQSSSENVAIFDCLLTSCFTSLGQCPSSPPYEGHWVQREMRSGEQEWKEVAIKMVHPSLPMHDAIPCLARSRVRATISVGDCILFYEYMHGDYRVHLDLKVLAANPG